MHSLLAALALLTSVNALPPPIERLCLAHNASDLVCHQGISEPDFIGSTLASCLENISESPLEIIPCYEKAIAESETVLAKGDPYLFEIRQNLSVHYDQMVDIYHTKGGDDQAFYFLQKEFSLLGKNLKIAYTRGAFSQIYALFLRYPSTDRHHSLQIAILSFFERFSREEDPYYLDLAQKLSLLCKETLAIPQEKQVSNIIAYLLANTIFQGVEIMPFYTIKSIKDEYHKKSYWLLKQKIREWSGTTWQKIQKILKRREDLAFQLQNLTKKIPKYISKEELFYWQKIHNNDSLENLSSESSKLDKIPEKLADFYYDKGFEYRKKERKRDEAILYLEMAYPLYQYIHSKKIEYIHYYLSEMYYGLGFDAGRDPEKGCEYAYKISNRHFNRFSWIYIDSVFLKISCSLRYMIEKLKKRFHTPCFSFSVADLLLSRFTSVCLTSYLSIAFLCFLIDSLFLDADRIAFFCLRDLGGAKTIDFVDKTTLFSFSDVSLYLFKIEKKAKESTLLPEVMLEKKDISETTRKALLSPTKAFVYFDLSNLPDQYGFYDFTQSPTEFKLQAPKIAKGIWLPSEKLLGFREDVLCIRDPVSNKNVDLCIFCEHHRTPVCVQYAKIGKYAVSASEDELFFWNMSERSPQYQVAPSCVNYTVYEAYQEFLNNSCSQAVEKLILNYLGAYLFGHSKVCCEKIVDLVIADQEKKVLVLTDEEVFIYNVSDVEDNMSQLKPLFYHSFGIKITPNYLKCSPDGKKILVHGKHKEEEVVYLLSTVEKKSRRLFRSKNKKQGEILCWDGRMVQFASFLPDSYDNQIALSCRDSSEGCMIYIRKSLIQRSNLALRTVCAIMLTIFIVGGYISSFRVLLPLIG